MCVCVQLRAPGETSVKRRSAEQREKIMQCGVETMNDCERSPGRTGLRVNFTEKGEVKERREKFLTAKYGSHQMSLIRKRLAVEMWLYDELQKLFDPPVSSDDPLRSSQPTIYREPRLINTFNVFFLFASFFFLLHSGPVLPMLPERRQKLLTWTSTRF